MSTTHIISEASKLVLDPKTNGFRVCLIEEGEGSSADYPRSFFTPENAQRYAGVLSFNDHPPDPDQPHTRNPMTAVGRIGESVTIEEHNGKLSFWSSYHPSKSKPEVAAYLEEFGPKLGLSVYGFTNGYNHPETGKWITESLPDDDPYRSVDLVVAAGAKGRFDTIVAESLRRVYETSASAGEIEEINMEKIDEVQKDLADLKLVVENLVKTLTGKADAAQQVEADKEAVEKAVAESLANYDKAVALISEAKLTESQSAELREAAMKGEDIAPRVESAKKIIAEARAGYSGEDAGAHLGGGDGAKGFDPFVPGFGKV